MLVAPNAVPVASNAMEKFEPKIGFLAVCQVDDVGNGRACHRRSRFSDFCTSVSCLYSLIQRYAPLRCTAWDKCYLGFRLTVVYERNTPNSSCRVYKKQGASFWNSYVPTIMIATAALNEWIFRGPSARLQLTRTIWHRKLNSLLHGSLLHRSEQRAGCSSGPHVNCHNSQVSHSPQFIVPEVLKEPEAYMNIVSQRSR
jgi:hypothetical protein